MVITVIGRPGGDVSFVQVLDAGQVADARLGDDKDAQVTWTVTAEVARQLAAGELDPSVAFMQGRLKTAGHPGLVLDVLAATATAPFRAYRERLAEAGRPAPDAA